MRFILPCSLALVFICSFDVIAQKGAAPPSIALEQLQQATVIGSIGQPLGMVVEIEATIIDGDETRLRQYSGRYLLRVDNVAGKPLAKRPLMTFGAAFSSSVKLPTDGFQLYERKYGRKPNGLSDEERQKLEAGFVNSTVRYLAYETGSFHGIPNRLPNDYPVWADVGLGFSTYLLLVQEVSVQ